MTDGPHESELHEEHEGDGSLGHELGLREDKRTHRPGRSAIGCLVLLVLIGLVLGIGYLGITRGAAWLDERFSDPEDYDGEGTGQVLVQVREGQSASAIAQTLEQKDVVASSEAFVDVARERAGEASRIQAGFFQMRLRMSADAAMDVLSDPSNIRTSAVTVPEGLRVVDIVELMADKTKFSRAQFEEVLDRPGALGLPAYAQGNPEGYLFPATYAFAPNAKPAEMLKAMVTRWREAADEAGLEEAAAELGYTPHELMTIASLVEAEGRGDDMARIARVIYNRLEGPGDKGGTNGRLQIDATVNYALDRKGVAAVSTEDLKVDSPYNTYTNVGLPPGPVEAPGDEAIKAAAEPADGPWYYYVTVNLATGETKFAETYDEFLTYKQELRDYCATQSDRC
jgi:UPF0755 protein